MLLAEDPGLELVAAVASPADIVSVCRNAPADVVVVDLEHTAIEGKELGFSLQQACPDARLVGVAGSDHADLALRAIELGLSAVYVKTAPSEELIDLVKRAGAGETVIQVFPPAHVRTDDAVASDASLDYMSPRLTPREREVLQNLAEGRGTAQVARELAISPLTVQSHVKSILEKLGVHSKIEAVTLAFRRGMVEVPGSRVGGQRR